MTIIPSPPQVHFQIATPMPFIIGIADLQYNKNCSLYPNYIPFNLKEMLEKIDFYLDINHGPEWENILTIMKEKNVPIFAYEETAHRKEWTYHHYPINNLRTS
ncbi:TPA: hypothetical protein ACGO0Y_001776 [Streptococcus suis]